MSVEELKAIQRHLFEEMNKGKTAWLAVMDEVYATNLVVHSGGGGDIHSLKNYKQYVSELADAFPDFHFTINDMVVEGDKVAVRFTTSATHKGEYMGAPPTNNKITGWVISIDRIVGGKIVERWERSDTLSTMQQVGVKILP